VAQQAQHLLKKKTGPSRIEEKRNEKRDIPVKNGIPQIRTDKCSTVFDPAPGSLCPIFGPVSVYPGKNENGREKTVYGCGRNGIHPVRFHPWHHHPRPPMAGTGRSPLYSVSHGRVKNACCKLQFQVFQRYVASVSDGCCKSGSGCCICCNGCTPMLQASIFNVTFFRRMLQMCLSRCCICFRTYVVSVLSRCYTCL
jgi:hypothetical protein